VVPEPVVRATQQLDGILARGGASPAVTAALWRAFGRLRMVAAGGGRDAESAALREASRGLADCVAAIEGSPLVADRELAEAISGIQRSIDGLLGATMPPSPRAPGLGVVGPAPVPRPSKIETPRMFDERAPPVPSRSAPNLVARLPSASSTPLQWKVTGAVAPVPPAPVPRPPAPRPAVRRDVVPAGPPPLKRRPPARPPLASAIAAKGEQLAQGILARIGGDYDRRTNLLANPLLRWDRLAEVDVPLARDGMVLAWMDPSNIAVLRALVVQSDGDDRPALDRALGSASLGHEADAREKLIADVDDPDDGVAMAAILTLAWTGDTSLAAPILARTHSTASNARAAALLLASVALGSTAALAEARARVTANGDVDPRLYDALAIGGDDSDADRLLRSAARAGERHAERAVLALGHLGSARVAAELTKLTGTIDPRVLDEALAATFGDRPADARRAEAPGRLLRGRPWSIGGAVTRLLAPNEPIRSRERMALDLAVRTGLRPPVRYDLAALASRQTRAAETLSATFTANASALRPGNWYYFGRPAPRF
jgi:hypothetical protein